MTSEEYLTEVARIARGNFRPNDSSQSMTVAQLGLLVRRVTGIDPADCGFIRFKDALLALEERGVLRTGLNSKQAFAFWLGQSPIDSSISESLNTPPPLTTSTTAERARPMVRRLRSQLWQAFVGFTPKGRRFMNRHTGEIVVGQQDVPASTGPWVEIQPIDPSQDKAEAEQFLAGEALSSDEGIARALKSQAWFHEFAKAVQAADPRAAYRWKRRRSLRVIAEAEKWRAQHDLPPEFVYETSSERFRTHDGRSDTKVGPISLRDALIGILKNMSTGELLELRLPVRDVVAAIRPDLLQS